MKRIPHNGLQGIRTMSERGSDMQRPHRKFLLLAMLELEKTRRTQEKESAGQRAANIDKRLAEIVEEQTRLLASVEVAPPAAISPTSAPSPPAPQGEFTIRY